MSDVGFFAFDHSRRALVYPDPTTGKPRHITIQELATLPVEELGGATWNNVDEAALRRALPRWDKSILETSVSPSAIPKRRRW
jgi:hypothetical protein